MSEVSIEESIEKCKVHERAVLAEQAVVRGDVTIEEDSSVWYHATVRGEEASVIIGRGCNIQDNAVVHVDAGYPVRIGDYVTVGHSAIVHGCTVKDHTLVGMGAILLNGATIGKCCIIGAGALVPQNMVIPDYSLVIGCPCKILRTVTEEEIKSNRANAEHYIREARKILLR